MGGLNPLDQIHPWVIVSVIAIFCATLYALRRVFFLPYIETMEERETTLEQAEAKIAEAERTTADARADAERTVDEARAEAQALIEKSRGEDDAYRRETVGAAQAALASTLEHGRTRIAKERAKEVDLVRGQAVECVTLACEQLLGETDRAAVTGEVDKLLARRLQ